MSNFCNIAQEKFSFLETDFEFDLISEIEEEWGGEVIYVNNKTGVKLLYEITSSFVFIFIYKLIDGEMVDNPLPINANTKISCFDFNDMLVDNVKMKPAFEYKSDSIYFDEKHGLANYVEDFAFRLKKYGKSILKGDFSVLPTIEKIIKNRAKVLK